MTNPNSTDGVPEVDPTEKLRRALGDIISQTVVIERIGSEDWQDWQKKNQRVRQIASAALAPGVPAGSCTYPDCACAPNGDVGCNSPNAAARGLPGGPQE